MNGVTDQQLLREYSDARAEAAFVELVRRHVDLVFSAALRMVRDAHLAEDVTQGVFIALAQNARQLAGRPVLAGWLHRTAQNLAAKVVRTDSRRRAREQEAAAMNELHATEPAAIWEDIAPELDAALGRLSDADRDAILLRYFEGKSARAMAGIFGVSEDAAQKRVNRAVERLRACFAGRGAAISASGLAAILTAHAVQSAPAGLAAGIATAAVMAEMTAPALTAIAATKLLAMTTLQKTLIVVTLAAAVGTAIYQYGQAAALRRRVQALEQAAAATPPGQPAVVADAPAWSPNAIAGMKGDAAELLKLRGEVTRLRAEARGLPSARVAALKRLLAQMPDKAIPEMRFLTEKDWTTAAWDADLDTDDGARLALRKLRDEAMDRFRNLMRPALQNYLAANDNNLPTDLLQLKPYFSTPVTDDMLQRYELMQTGKLSADNSQAVVRTKVYADPEYDSNQEMSMSGGGGSSFNKVQQAILSAAGAYAVANNGQLPGDPSQIAAYLNQPIDPATVQKYLTEIAADPPPPEAVTIIPALNAYAAAHNGDYPKNPADLEPYLTTPEQQAALKKLAGMSGLVK